MNTHTDKNQENKSQSVSAAGPLTKSIGESTFQFADNRPEAVAQRKLQEMANNSQRVSQLRAFSVLGTKGLQLKQSASIQMVPAFEGSMSSADGQPGGHFTNTVWRAEPGLHEAAEPGRVIIGDLTIDQTKHHVIPLQKLRTFISAINGSEEQLALLAPLFTASTNTMMSNSPRFVRGGDGPHADESVPKQGDVTGEMITAEIAKEPDADRHGSTFGAIISSFAWMPGNLFIGPSQELRIEDPGENFEAYANAPTGALWQTLTDANRAIDTYLEDRSNEKAAAAIQLLQTIAEQTNFHPYNPQHWEIVHLTQNDFTFNNMPGTTNEEQVLNDVLLFGRKRYLFRLRNSPTGWDDNTKRANYIARFQAAIDARIIELNAPPPPLHVNHHDDSDDEGPFGGMNLYD